MVGFGKYSFEMMREKGILSSKEKCVNKDIKTERRQTCLRSFNGPELGTEVLFYLPSGEGCYSSVWAFVRKQHLAVCVLLGLLRMVGVFS